MENVTRADHIGIRLRDRLESSPADIPPEVEGDDEESENTNRDGELLSSDTEVGKEKTYEERSRRGTETYNDDSLTLTIRPTAQPNRTNTTNSLRSKRAKTKPGVVRFKEPLMTGISRPLNSAEHWVLYYFEFHAMSCQSCKAGTKSAKAAGGLCEEGLKFALDVQGLKFSMRDEQIYAPDEIQKKGKGLQMRVEIPHNYKYSRRLIRTMSKSSWELAFSTGFSKSPSSKRTDHNLYSVAASDTVKFDQRGYAFQMSELKKRGRTTLLRGTLKSVKSKTPYGCLGSENEEPDTRQEHHHLFTYDHSEMK